MKKALFILLAVILMMAMMPVAGFAATTINVRTTAELNAAITSSADGDTIFVFDGNYTLTTKTIIDKNLTITGESEDGVVLSPSVNTGTSGDDRGWIVVNDGVTLNLSSLTMDGTGIDVYQAVRAHGEVNVSDVTICNIIHPGYKGLGIAIIGGGSISDVSMHDIGRVGIAIYGTDVRHDTTVNGFDYVGKGAVDGLDYAIEVGAMNGTSVPFQVDISNLTVSNNVGVASTDGSTSAAVLISTFFYALGGGSTPDLLTVNIDHAAFSNCTGGVCVGYTDGYNDFSNVTITNSNFFGIEYDITLADKGDSSSIDAPGNYFGGGAPVVWISDGNIATGFGDYVTTPVPMNQDTEVTAGIDPTYMIIIPAAVDFGTLIKDTGVQTQVFPVQATGVIIESGHHIDVDVAGPFMMMDENGLGSVPLAYSLSNESGTVTPPSTFATFTGDETEDGTVSVDTAAIAAAGSYKGTMNFTISYQ